jgi:hypothetical protein
MVLIFEAHGDAVVGKCPQVLAQHVPLLPLPLARQELRGKTRSRRRPPALAAPGLAAPNIHARTCVIWSRPRTNSARLRHSQSRVYAPATRWTSLLFQVYIYILHYTTIF